MVRLIACAWLFMACGNTSGDAPDSTTDPDVEALIADGAAFDDRYTEVVVAFAGDCQAAAAQLLSLEPLARSVRTHLAALGDDRSRFRTLLRRSQATHESETARHVALMKRLGATEGDILRNEPAMRSQCASDPKFRDASARTSRQPTPVP